MLSNKQWPLIALKIDYMRAFETMPQAMLRDCSTKATKDFNATSSWNFSSNEPSHFVSSQTQKLGVRTDCLNRTLYLLNCLGSLFFLFNILLFHVFLHTSRTITCVGKITCTFTRWRADGVRLRDAGLVPARGLTLNFTVTGFLFWSLADFNDTQWIQLICLDRNIIVFDWWC